MSRVLMVVIGLVVAVGPLAAGARSQTAAAGAPLTFEVASIKLIRLDGSAAGAVAGGVPGRIVGRFNYGGPIDSLVQRAYGIRDAQLVGAPDWLGSDDFNYRIAATIPEGVEGTVENINAMIRSLLSDRFKLVAREETRDLPIYELVHARADKRLGPNISPVPPECLVPGSKCETRFGGGPNAMRRPAGELGLEGRNATVQALSNGPFSLEGRVDRLVFDRTGLTGRYNFDLRWADERPGAPPSSLPSLFTALQEQLGLKLVSTRGRAKVLVIASIERPTED
jgi:uncharacterized protein (TIGR03435 family)